MKNNNILKIIAIVFIVLILSLIIIVSIKKFSGTSSNGDNKGVDTENETFKTKLDGKYNLDNTSIILFSLNENDVGFLIHENNTIVYKYIIGEATFTNDEKTKAKYTMEKIFEDEVETTYEFELKDDNLSLTITPNNISFKNSIYTRQDISKKQLLLDYIQYSISNEKDLTLDYINNDYNGIYELNNYKVYLFQYSKNNVLAALYTDDTYYNNKLDYNIKDKILTKVDTFWDEEDTTQKIELDKNKIIMKNTKNEVEYEDFSKYNGTYQKKRSLTYEDIATIYSDGFTSINAY